MTPITPIIPGFDVPTVNFAENQEEYTTLPAYRDDEGMVVTRWKLSWKERFKIFFFGDLWLSVLTFNKPLQPVKLDVTCPIFGHFMGDKEV